MERLGALARGEAGQQALVYCPFINKHDGHFGNSLYFRFWQREEIPKKIAPE